MEGVSTAVATDEQSEEVMSFLFQDMMRHSISPQMAPAHVLHPMIEADLTRWWRRDGYNSPHAQASVDREFVMGTHFNQGQADLIMSSVANCASLGNDERKFHQDQPQLQLQGHHSSPGERTHNQDSLEMNHCYEGLSGLQIEQCAPGEVVIDMGSQPMPSNITYVPSSALSDSLLSAQDLSSSHGDSLFPSQKIVTDTAMTQAIAENKLLHNTVNSNKFGNLVASPTMYVKQDSIYNRAVAPTAPLSVQYEFVNHIPEAVLTSGLHHSRLPLFHTIAKPYTPIEITVPFPTPGYNEPVLLHHPNAAPSYFLPMSSNGNEPLVVPSHGSSDKTMAPPQVASSTMMNGRIEAAPLFQSIGPVDPSVARAIVPMQLAHSWSNMAHGPQVFSHTLHQSLELMHRLQALQQQQQQRQQDPEFNQGALHRNYENEVDPVSGDSRLSTPQSTTTPLPDTPASTVPRATPQQFQHFPEGTVNLSAIHSSSNLDDKSSMFSPEKAQTVIDLDHSEVADFKQDDKDEEECVVESDDGDSSYLDDGNNVSSSSYLDEEDEIDSDDDILLHKKRTPSPLSSSLVEGSSEEASKRHCRTTARTRRTRTSHSLTVPETEQSSRIEAQHSRRLTYTTGVCRARTPHAPELVEEAAEHTPSTETVVKSRKPRARQASTYTRCTESEGVDDDNTPLSLHAPNVLEDGSIKCTYLGCPRTFATMGLLRSHLVVHVDGKPYVCEMCDGAKRYKRNHDLLRHQREIHGEEGENEEDQVNDEMDEAEDGGDDMDGSKIPVSHRKKREEGSYPRGGTKRTSSGRNRKHRRTRVEHRTIWNGSEMEEIEVEMVRPRGRPRVRPLKESPDADAFALISSSSSSSSIALTARPQAPSQNADTAKRLHEWLRIEAQATAAWSTVPEPTNQSQTQRGSSCSPVFGPLVEKGESSHLIKRDEDELVMTGQWRALNERAADIQSQGSAYVLHNLKEWISAPEGFSPRSPGNMIETMFNALEAPPSPTCNVAANIVAAATERGVAVI
ncbi:hypothetical protein BGZ81_000579 [Podila clonocystis]|nr:hypothetical protein BGZ81_000579 [Podila clonocystis]